MKKITFILSILFSTTVLSQSPVEKSFPKGELFSLGSYYYPEQWDSSQWERDLKKMSDQVHPFCGVLLVYDGTGRRKV